MRIYLILFVLFFVFIQNCIAQPGGPFTPKTSNSIAPTAPQAYQFQKYGETPMDIKTGLPQIQIPLHSLQLRDISWNIGLQYNARGFKPSEMATAAGLGWTFQGNGIISIQGIGPSDLTTPYNEDSMVLRRTLELVSSGSITGDCTYENQQDILRVENALSPALQRNYLPDIYNLSMPGLSLKFFIHNDTGYTIPASDVRIILQKSYVNGNFDKAQITIQDEKSVKYYFSTKGSNQSLSLCEVGRATLSGSISWIFYIDSVKSLKGDYLKFYYHDETYTYESTPSITYNEKPEDLPIGPCSNFNPGQYAQTCSTNFTVRECFLDSIQASNGETISFKHSARQDIAGISKIDTIHVRQGGEIKKILFSNSYFGTVGNNNLRLKLDSVAVINKQTNLPGEKYLFQYNSVVLPAIQSRSFDYWGFYNGKPNGGNNPRLFQREPSLQYSKACVMERIVYPTGGVTDFIYELNEHFGGLRIQSIEDRNTFTAKPLRRQYRYSTNASIFFPSYEQNLSRGYVYSVPAGTEFTYCPYIRYSSYASSSRTPYRSDNYFYKKVVEYYGDMGSLGKIEYDFQAAQDYSYNTFDLEAKLVKKASFKRLNPTEFQKSRTEEYVYNAGIDPNLNASGDAVFRKPTSRKEKRLWGVIFTQTEQQQYLQPGICLPKRFTQEHFALCSFSEYLTKKKVTDFVYVNGTSDSIIQEELFSYESENHFKPTRIIKINSQHDTLVQTMIYCKDYPDGNAANDFLKANNMLAEPIETVYSKTKSGGAKVFISAGLTEFDQTIIPVKSYYFSGVSPIPLNTFKFSNSLLGQFPFEQTNKSYSPDSRYTLESKVTQINNGNTVEVKTRNSSYASYYWDTLNRPTAVVPNARVGEIAYNSFETADKGYFTFSGSPTADNNAFTGQFCYSLSGNPISKAGLTSTRSYIVSYWGKNGTQSVNGTTGEQRAVQGGWVNFEHSVMPSSGIITITGSGIIDEVRLYPQGAQMTTYTYGPLVGMIAQNDLNAKASYYEYDGFGKLRLIRDQSRNIVKMFEYSLGNSYGASTWQNTGQLRCKPCLINPNFNERINQMDQIDINPTSGSYNTYRWIDWGFDTTCVPNDWQLVGAPVCETVNGQLTGWLLTTQANINPCSEYYESQRVIREINLNLCPFVCNTSSCSGVDKKCVNGICETAIIKKTSTVWNGRHYICTYSYVWSDGSSAVAYVVINPVSC